MHAQDDENRRRHDAPASLWWLALGAGLMCLLGPLGAFSRLLAPVVGFGIFGMAGALAMIVAVIGVVGLVRRGLGPRRVRAVAVASLTFLAVAFVLRGAVTTPPINDVSTDLDDPPALLTGPAAGEPLPEAFLEAIRAAYGDLATEEFPGAMPTVVVEATEAEMEARGWSEITVDEGADGWRIGGVAESALFRFRDDVVVRLRPTATGVAVDMRSRSRVGRSDFGANAARIEAFLDALESRL